MIIILLQSKSPWVLAKYVLFINVLATGVERSTAQRKFWPSWAPGACLMK
jgi:hypothetical protein